jgi:hypothetical protein
MDAEQFTNGVLAKDSPIGKIKLQFTTSLSNGLYTSRRIGKYLVKMTAAGTKDDKLYDNFTNDYLYANPNNILVFAGKSRHQSFQRNLSKRYSKIQDGNGCTGNGAWYSSIVLR